MSCMLQLRRLLGAVIVMIAFLGASSGAQAHSGHEHAPAPQLSLRSTASADAIPASDHAVHASEIAAKAAIPAASKSSKPCMGGCCSRAHACCSFNISNTLAGASPAGLFRVQAFVEPPLRDGLSPEALRKPPRAFA
jgi:hypothetical protein